MFQPCAYGLGVWPDGKIAGATSFLPGGYRPPDPHPFPAYLTIQKSWPKWVRNPQLPSSGPIRGSAGSKVSAHGFQASGPNGAEVHRFQGHRSTIKINNEVTNLTAAVKDILDPERTGKTYNGVVFWKYKGETLWDRRKRIRGE